MTLGAPEYAALLTFFTGGLIVINWMWIRRLLPRNRLYDLVQNLEDEEEISN